MAIMKLTAVLLLVIVGVAHCYYDLNLLFDHNASPNYQVYLSGQAWLKSGPVAVRNGDDVYFSDDKTLMLIDQKKDRTDEFDLHTFTWAASNGSFKMTTYVKVFMEDPVVVFGQVFDDGAVAGSKPGDYKKLRSSFPTFETAGADLGSIVFSGGQLSETMVGRWPKEALPSGEDGGFPVVLFDAKMENTIVLSPMNTFMSSLQATWQSKADQKDVFGFGIMDSVEEIPKGYVYETVLVAGENVTETMMMWGRHLQRFYNRDDSYRYSDFTVNYLGYWTDNGACYHYCTGKYDNYEDALVDMKKYADEQNIPYRYLQLDSWWYYKGTHDGVKNWTAMASVFPHGLNYIAETWRTPIVAHNRFWSNNTDYAKQNGGEYTFLVDGAYAMPTEYSFWLDLMTTAETEWNLLVYEQDWLFSEYEGLTELSTELNLGREWLMQMGNAAQARGLTVQYCMTWVRHLLQAVEIPAVTQVRASGDYHPSNSQWKMGDSTILIDSLGIAAFKDNFHSVKVEADCCKLPTTENDPALEATISALSKGPVGIGDEVGVSDRTQIMSTCMSDGRLLKPTRPAKSLDSTFVKRAFQSNGPDGELYAAYTELAGLTWYYIVAAEIASPYELKAQELPPSRTTFPKTSFPLSLAFRYNLKGTILQAQNFTSFSTISIPTCDRTDFLYWVIAPVLPGNGVALLGELNKVVTVSETRFQNIVVYDSRDFILNIVGDPGETVTLSTYLILLGKLNTASCQITEYGTASYRVDEGGSISCM